MTTAASFVGLDVSKAQIDVAVLPADEHWQVAHTEAGLSELAARLTALQPAGIVVEATGGYETAVVAALAVAGLPVAVVNPRQVRDFAKALQRLAMTGLTIFNEVSSRVKVEGRVGGERIDFAGRSMMELIRHV